MAQSAAFWDRVAVGYARRPISDEAAYQTKLAKTRAYFTPESRVLELGCGTGSTALLHAPHVAQIRATDISGKMIEIAKRKAAEQGIENVSFERASVEEITAPDGGYDVVLALNLLHLLPDYAAVIARVYGMTKPGGVFITSTACLNDSMYWFKPIAAVGRWLGRIPPIAFFTTADYERAMTAPGFVIEHAWRPGPGKTLFMVARKPG